MIVEIDGSFGEGGGQILRTSLTLSVLTGTPFRMFNIRKNRPKPGLQHQHLTAVKVVKALSNAITKGDFLGSEELYFEPKGIVDRLDYRFDVGTAGSVTLILQTVLPLMINRNISLTLIGGTDVPKAPTIDYIRLVFLPLLERLGLKAKVELIRRGHYPEGGGEIRISDVRGELSRFELINRGKILRIEGISHVSSLPDHIATRQKTSAESLLKELGVPVNISIDVRSGERSKGSGIALAAITENSVLGADSLGERGVRAETVGETAARTLLEDLKSGAAVDRHMSDMLMLYAALARGSFTGAELTSHAKTNAEVIRKFLNIDYEISGSKPFTFRVR
jgi:RNA 3'-terminal phosphate cyclase (ATP)